jgi:acetyl-CoA acyltransferase
VGSSKKALKRAGISVDDLDVVELNEAFASQSLASIRDLGLDTSKINIDGGALALGHPLGATGARITAKAAQILKRERGRYALATQCIGGGQGIATVLEFPSWAWALLHMRPMPEPRWYCWTSCRMQLGPPSRR